MSARYDVRHDLAGVGWTVYDVSTGEPAEWNGVQQVGLGLADADDLADLLNRMDRKRRDSGDQ